MKLRCPPVLLLLSCLFFGPWSLPARSQEKSLAPGINKPYEDPDVERSVRQFEGEQREVSTLRKEILAACQLKPGMAVADIGAGSGLFTRLFAAEVGPGGKVYAVDVSAKFIEHIEKTCKESGIRHVEGIVCKEDSSGLPACSVDLLFICDTYHHFEYPRKTLASLHRALRPGGKLVLIDYRRVEGKTPEWMFNHLRAGQEVFTREIEAAGFKVLDEAGFLKDNYLVRFEKAGDFTPAPAALCCARQGLGNVLDKLGAGKEVRIAYFGGSITAAEGWRPKTLAWFQKQYPKATVREINAAIGGTGSDLGVFRYQQDVLRHKPDLVFVEFSVNDGGAPPEAIYRAMEGIVRQTWRADPAIDLCFVYTFRVGYEKDLDRGYCPTAPSAHEHVAEHYGIPSINVALRAAQLAGEGKLVLQAEKGDASPDLAGKILFSHDGVHPLDAGHDLYAQVIAEALPEIEKQSKPAAHALPAPFRARNLEGAKLVPIEEKMLQGSWRQMDRQAGAGKWFENRLPVIWEGSKPGDQIEFRFKGTMVGLYDLVGPDGGQVVWNLDGKQSGPRPRFDSFCTYHRLASLRFAENLEDKEHHLVVKIHPEQPDRNSVLSEARKQPGFDPKKYEGTRVWAGALMIVGEPLP